MTKPATAWDIAIEAEIIARHRDLAGPLLPIFHALQDRFGYIDQGAIPRIADALNLSRAEIHGVFTFYHDFRDRPPGRHVVKLCRAEACQAMGGRALQRHIERRLNIACGETGGNGRYSLDAVYCLGFCASAPALLLDGEPHARVTLEDFDRLLDAIEEPA